jgi:hypothetical protein
VLLVFWGFFFLSLFSFVPFLGTDVEAFLRGVTSRHHIVINVETGARREAKRPPFSLAIVLDRSGSMAGGITSVINMRAPGIESSWN